MCLEENPNIWYHSLPKTISENKELLKQEFLIKYGLSSGENRKKMFDYFDLKQNDSESSADYINRLNAVCEDLEITDEMKIVKLRYKCKPELVVPYENEPKTACEAEQRLRSAEVLSKYINKKETDDELSMVNKLKAEIRELEESQKILKDVVKSSQPVTIENHHVNTMAFQPEQRRRSSRLHRRRNPCTRCRGCDHLYHLNVVLLELSATNAKPSAI